jgi:hypothetical protein
MYDKEQRISGKIEREQISKQRIRIRRKRAVVDDANTKAVTVLLSHPYGHYSQNRHSSKNCRVSGNLGLTGSAV